MKKYCIDYPCCPSCNEPFINRSPLKKVEMNDLCLNCQICVKDNNIKICPIDLYKFRNNKDNFFYYCPNCMTYFISKVDLNSYTHIANKLKEMGTSTFQPIFWDIELNKLEENYIEWFLNENNTDKCFITWPYDNINFIIILINEYLLKNNNKKVVILENDYENKLNDEYKNLIMPNTENLISSTYTYHIKDELSDELQSERKKFNKKIKENITLKSNKINYHLKFIYKTDMQNDFKEDAHFNDEELKVGDIRKKFDEIYGAKSIRDIIIDGKKRGKTNEEGIFEVKVNHNYERPKKINYSYNYFNILNNFKDLNPIDENIKYQKLYEDSEIDFNNNVFILKFDNQNKFDFIDSINPDLLIIKDSENTYNKTMLNEISDFVSSFNSKVLFFSINKYNRLTYKKNLKSFTLQTFDNNLILSHLLSNKDKNKKNSIFSPVLDKNTVSNIDYNILYNKVEVFDEMDKLSDQIITDFKESNIYNDEIRRFLYLMINTPMIMDKNYEYSFSYMDKDIYTWLSYLSDEKRQYYSDKLDEIYENDYSDDMPLPEDFVQQIKENLDEKRPVFIISPTKKEIKPIKRKIKNKFKNEKLDGVVVDVIENLQERYVENMFPISYKNDLIYSNPILDEIIEEIKKYNETNMLIYVVSPTGYYSKSIRKEIENRLKNKLKAGIKVGVWKDINKISLTYNQQIQIISTTRPYNLDLYNENFKNITFISSPRYIKYIKESMEKKISESSIRPFEPDTENQYPEVLKEVTSKQDIEENDELLEIEDYIYTIENTKDKYVHTNKHVKNLKENENVLLLLNENNEGIFIPAKHSITYKKNNTTLDTISSKEYSQLINKTILIDRNGFYNTYKEFFTKFMLLNGENLKFEINNNIIEGYHNLIQLANLWLDGFKIIINEEIQKNPEMKLNKIKQRVANLLINCGVHYDSTYIRNYWLEDPIELETNFGTLNLYSIEHPRNVNTITEVYKNLNERYEKFNYSELDAYNSFNAARAIQKIRGSLLKQDNLYYEYRGLSARFKLEIENIIKNSDSFKVVSYQEVTIRKEIKPYVKITDFNQYIN